MAKKRQQMKHVDNCICHECCSKALRRQLNPPEKVGPNWRIRRRDGVLVGWYATKELALKAIDKSPYFD